MTVWVLIIYLTVFKANGPSGVAITTIENLPSKEACMFAKRQVDAGRGTDTSTQCVMVQKVKP